MCQGMLQGFLLYLLILSEIQFLQQGSISWANFISVKGEIIKSSQFYIQSDHYQ